MRTIRRTLRHAWRRLITRLATPGSPLEAIDAWVRCCAHKAARRAARTRRTWLAHQHWIMPVGLAILVYIAIHDTTVTNRQTRRQTEQAIAVARINGRQVADEAAARAQIKSAVHGCQRLQIINETANTNTLRDYRLLLGEIDSLRLVGQPTRSLELTADGYEWVPRVACAQRVSRQGTNYRLPQPVRFSEQMPPARSLLPGTDDISTPIPPHVSPPAP